MKHAKKLLCLALAMVMSLSLVACSSSSGDGKADGSDAAIDHDREVVYGSASLITNFNVKYVTAQNDLQALDFTSFHCNFSHFFVLLTFLLFIL